MCAKSRSVSGTLRLLPSQALSACSSPFENSEKTVTIPLHDAREPRVLSVPKLCPTEWLQDEAAWRAGGLWTIHSLLGGTR